MDVTHSYFDIIDLLVMDSTCDVIYGRSLVTLFIFFPHFLITQIAVGDRDGVLQVFGTKKGDLGFNFKTLPGKEICRLELGGALGMCNYKNMLTVFKTVNAQKKNFLRLR